ncbi:hypothetical protein GOODEAATRI_008871, partial [Goodea atripinnis]
VRNLMMDTTEETLHREFSRFKPGSVERVKKLTDYAFIHYRSRHDAIAAMSLMNGVQIDGAIVEVTLAKPAGIKDGSAAGRRYNPRGYLGNTATGGASDGRSLLRATPLQTRLGNPHYDRGVSNHSPEMSRMKNCCRRPSLWLQEDSGRCMLPLLPCTPLTPISLLALKQSQIGSAVSLLEYYCHKNCWSPPEYHLYSTPGQDGKLLLIYKVVLPSTRATYLPDKLCVLLDDAKELAAQTTLWNLGNNTLMHEAVGSRNPFSL